MQLQSAAKKDSAKLTDAEKAVGKSYEELTEPLNNSYKQRSTNDYPILPTLSCASFLPERKMGAARESSLDRRRIAIRTRPFPRTWWVPRCRWKT